MPGPLIHMSNARHTARQLIDGRYRPHSAEGVAGDIDPNWTGTDIALLGKVMTDHPNFTAIGAVGPDLFFFLPDFRNIGPIPTSTVLADVLGFLEGLYATLDPYLSKWEHYLGPISE